MSSLRSIVPADAEIDDVFIIAFDAVDGGESNYPGVSYEEGVLATLEWIFGDSNCCPFGKVVGE